MTAVRELLRRYSPVAGGGGGETTVTVYDQADNAWHTHIFPGKHKSCRIFALQGGGSGGRGRNELTGSSRCGGGGGGSGAYALWEGPIIDNLEIFLPPPASGATAGADAGMVRVAIGAQDTAQTYELLRSGNAIAGSGGNGGGAAGGTAGSGGAVYPGTGRYTGFGSLRTTAGVAGTSGGANGGAGNSLTPSAVNNRTGGSGGGGCNTINVQTAGGAIIASGDITASAGGIAGAGDGAAGEVLTEHWLGKG